MTDAQQMWDDAHATARVMSETKDFMKKRGRSPHAFDLIGIFERAGQKKRRDDTIAQFWETERLRAEGLLHIATEIAKKTGFSGYRTQIEFIDDTREVLDQMIPRDPQLKKFLAWAKDNPKTEENENGNENSRKI